MASEVCWVLEVSQTKGLDCFSTPLSCWMGISPGCQPCTGAWPPGCSVGLEESLCPLQRTLCGNVSEHSTCFSTKLQMTFSKFNSHIPGQFQINHTGKGIMACGMDCQESLSLLVKKAERDLLRRGGPTRWRIKPRNEEVASVLEGRWCTRGSSKLGAVIHDKVPRVYSGQQYTWKLAILDVSSKKYK